jgi:acyl-coenzyme A thioesterase PaaI-like protein
MPRSERDVVAVLSNLVITFLRPALASDLIAEAKIIRIGRRLAYLETYLFSDGSAEPIAHATSQLRIPLRRRGRPDRPQQWTCRRLPSRLRSR